MNVNSISTAAAATAAAPAKTTTTQTLNYDAFLQLLIAEIRNQDPTEPMDSAQYIGQLASFSGVEQSVKANAKLDSLVSSIALLQADALIGKQVTSADGATTGIVKSLRATDTGAVAVLTSGHEVTLVSGVSVTEP